MKKQLSDKEVEEIALEIGNSVNRRMTGRLLLERLSNNDDNFDAQTKFKINHLSQTANRKRTLDMLKNLDFTEQEIMELSKAIIY